MSSFRKKAHRMAHQAGRRISLCMCGIHYCSARCRKLEFRLSVPPSVAPGRAAAYWTFGSVCLRDGALME